MSTFTVELPETLNRQIRGKGMSQQQLETLFFRVLRLYLAPAHHHKHRCNAINIT